MPFCRDCGSEMEESDQFCKSCGTPSDPNTPTAVTPESSEQAAEAGGAPSGVWIGGQMAILVGAVMMIIGPFMSWTTVVHVPFSGLDRTGNEALILVGLGALAIILALTSFVVKRTVLALIPLLVGLAGLAVSIYYYLAMRSDLEDLLPGLFGASLGAGIYICLAGSVLVLVGALFSGLRRVKE